MEDNQYIFIVYAVFSISIVLFSLLMNTILLKFITNLGIRGKDQPVIRWSNVAKPAIGGISLYVSFLLSTACYAIFFPASPLFHNTEALGIIGATVLAFLMGLADDAYNTKPWLKFFVQLICGGLLIVSGNFISFFDNDWLNYILTVRMDYWHYEFDKYARQHGWNNGNCFNFYFINLPCFFSYKRKLYKL